MDSCKRFKYLFSEYIENTLDKSQAELVKSHLSKCPECLGIIKRLKRLKSVFPVLKTIGVSPDFHTILRTRIRIETSMERRSILERIFDGQVSIPAYAASFAVILLIAFLILNQTGNQNEPEKTRLVTPYAPYSGQVIAKTDSDYSNFYQGDKTFYEIGLMYLNASSNDSIQWQNKDNDSDSLHVRERIEAADNFKNYQPVNRVSF